MRVRIRDECGLWSGPEMGTPAAPTEPPTCSSDQAAEFTCVVPWYIPRVAVEVLGACGWEPVPVYPGLQPCASLAAEGPEDHTVGLTIGEKRLWLPRSAASAAVEEPGRQALPIQVLREEPLRRLLPRLQPYELSQVSLLAFLLGFYVCLQLEVPRLLAAPLLAAIPVSRLFPEVLCLLQPGRFGVTPRLRQTLLGPLACLAAVLSAFLLLTLARRVYGPQAAPLRAEPRPTTPLAEEPPWPRDRQGCETLGGLDCSGPLSHWAGPGNCAVLVVTSGTCRDFCAAHRRACLRAGSAAAGGTCSLQPEAAPAWGAAAEESCLRDLPAQLCVCSGLEGPDAPTGPAPPAAALPPWPREPRPEPPAEAAPPVPPPGWPRLVPPCFLEDAWYAPVDMPGQGRTLAESATHCQRRCARTSGCAHFTWRQDGACHLEEFQASLKPSLPGASIAGPADCADADELEALLREPPRQEIMEDLGKIPQVLPQAGAPATRTGPAERRRPSRRRDFVGEGDPWLLVAIVLAFFGLAIAGVGNVETSA